MNRRRNSPAGPGILRRHLAAGWGLGNTPEGDTLEEQLQMFDASEGPSQAQSWQGDLAQFFAAIGRISQDELKKVENSSYVTDKFLKLIKTPLPSNK